MNRTHLRLLLLSAAVAATSGCASGGGESWIGSNVGVTVDSFCEEDGAGE